MKRFSRNVGLTLLTLSLLSGPALRAQTTPPPRPSIALSPEEFDRIAGYYQLQPGLIMWFRRDGARLIQGQNNGP